MMQNTGKNTVSDFKLRFYFQYIDFVEIRILRVLSFCHSVYGDLGQIFRTIKFTSLKVHLNPQGSFIAQHKSVALNASASFSTDERRVPERQNPSECTEI